MIEDSRESFERWWDGKESDNEWKQAFDSMVAEAIENEEDD